MRKPCDRCQAPDATVHLTEIQGGTKSERHLCSACADALNVHQPAKELHKLLETIEPVGKAVRRKKQEVSLSCPECGMTYAEFRQHGRFGCPHDYQAFSEELVRLLERIHGSSRYSGLTPRGGQVVTDGEVVDDLSRARSELRMAVEAENYEEAARLRDEIQRLQDTVDTGEGSS